MAAASGIHESSGDDRRETTQELLGRYRAGDREALGRLITAYYARIVTIVRVRLGPAMLERAAVEDFVQDVMARIVESAQDFEPQPGAAWIDWVARLAQNAIADRSRRESALKRGGGLAGEIRQLAESSSVSAVIDDSTGVVTNVARREMQTLLEETLARLPDAHREVILLRDYAGYDWKAIAEKMERASPEACQELHRRARASLRRAWPGGDPGL